MEKTGYSETIGKIAKVICTSLNKFEAVRLMNEIERILDDSVWNSKPDDGKVRVEPEKQVKRVKIERMVYEDMEQKVLFEFKNDFLFDNETEAKQFMSKMAYIMNVYVCKEEGRIAAVIGDNK